MNRILCFRLNGYMLGVEDEQIEKILVNRRPGIDEFTLTTGVEVKNLLAWIPLPGVKPARYENIIFIKGQKDYYGFSVDKVEGYLTLRSTAKLHRRKEGSILRYVIRRGDQLIPVLDLHRITNIETGLSPDLVNEILQFSEKSETETGNQEQEISEVSEEEIYRAIDEEIQKSKKTEFIEETVVSEKKGFVLPLVINIAIVILVLAGIFYYVISGREKALKISTEGTVSGVEEEVIKEIRRKSEEEVSAQKKKLEETKKRLNLLQKEKEYFLKNQDRILAEKEKRLQEQLQKQLEDARKRIIASGVKDVEGEYKKEKQRLYQEFIQERQQAQKEIESTKKQYEAELRKKEERLQQEAKAYSTRLGEMEKKLASQRSKLQEAQARTEELLVKQKAYENFRKLINMKYNEALGYFSTKEYKKGIDVLATMIPMIENAKKNGIGNSSELKVETRLVRNLMDLAGREKSRLDLNTLIRETYAKARNLERRGKNQDALMHYFTVYTISSDNSLRNKALVRANNLMQSLYNSWTQAQKLKMERDARVLFERARRYEVADNYDAALTTLHQLVSQYAGTTVVQQSLDEIVALNKKKEEARNKERISFINQKAREILTSANTSYNQGYFSDALDKYEEILKNYSESKYADKALAAITKINKEMKRLNVAPKVSLLGKAENSGVIIQCISENTMLVSLGEADGITKGDVLQAVRKKGKEVTFIGSLKVEEVYPSTSRVKVMYFEEKLSVGDMVVF